MSSVLKIEMPTKHSEKISKMKLATYSCHSASHSYSTSSDTVNNLSLDQELTSFIPQTNGENNRAIMKKLVRKQAKLQQRAISKSLKLIPHVCKVVADTATLIEK